MQIILWVAVVVALIVFPVMLSARALGAARSSFGVSLLAVLAQVVFAALTRHFAPSQLIALGIMVVGGSAIYAFILDTTVLRGFFISIMATVITAIAIVVLGSIFATVGAAL